MQKNPKISVIVPVYNGEEFLSQCLDSILAQTLQDIEILCVNDGSTDNSLKILKGYAKKDKRIQIINQKNQGLSASRNNAMKIAKGEYLSFVDADDYINEQFLEELYNSAIKENADIALGNIIRVENGEKPWLCYKKKQVADKTDDIFKLLNLPKTCYVWNRIYRREFILNNNLFFKEGITFEDIIWSPQVAYKAKKAVCVPKADYYYRYNEKSIVATSIKNPEKQKNIRSAHEFYNEFVLKNKLKVPLAWEKECLLRVLGLKLVRTREICNYKKEYFFCGIKIAQSKTTIHF